MPSQQRPSRDEVVGDANLLNMYKDGRAIIAEDDHVYLSTDGGANYHASSTVPLKWSGSGRYTAFWQRRCTEMVTEE